MCYVDGVGAVCFVVVVHVELCCTTSSMLTARAGSGGVAVEVVVD